MSWQNLLAGGSREWVDAYAGERITELARICCDRKSTDLDIRMAQAGIEEMELLKSAPARLESSAQQMKARPPKPRGEY